MKKNLLALFLALGLTLWAGAPAQAHPLTRGDCDLLRGYAEAQKINTKQILQTLQLLMLFHTKKDKDLEALVERHIASLKEMDRDFKLVAVIFGCPMPEKKAGKEQGEKK